ncbi:hypothetical protein N7466_000371 [Penicillium verhagenii]|uniref:uncharacterized protein n=1 Tax=Penicillium verhagenii TaxID=1562060 RepID=UPI002545881E|nr:uncharacterized protein N7466_000371 [Penicillium verhagenii]KAJ5947356.1 hypothetical protein N7466_000371 [Penicillium verhagenii]
MSEGPSNPVPANDHGKQPQNIHRQRLTAIKEFSILQTQAPCGKGCLESHQNDPKNLIKMRDALMEIGETAKPNAPQEPDLYEKEDTTSAKPLGDPRTTIFLEKLYMAALKELLRRKIQGDFPTPYVDLMLILIEFEEEGYDDVVNSVLSGLKDGDDAELTFSMEDKFEAFDRIDTLLRLRNAA